MTILYLLSEVEDKPCAYIGFQLVPYLNGRLIVQHGRTLGLKGDHMLDRLSIICMFGLFALSLCLSHVHREDEIDATNQNQWFF